MGPAWSPIVVRVREEDDLDHEKMVWQGLLECLSEEKHLGLLDFVLDDDEKLVRVIGSWSDEPLLLGGPPQHLMRNWRLAQLVTHASGMLTMLPRDFLRNRAGRRHACLFGTLHLIQLQACNHGAS